MLLLTENERERATVTLTPHEVTMLATASPQPTVASEPSTALPGSSAGQTPAADPYPYPAPQGLLTPTAGPGPSITPPSLWLSPAELRQLPTSGPAWQNLLDGAQACCLPHAAAEMQPDVYDKDDDADVFTLAGALVYARTGETAYRDAVLRILQQIMTQDLTPRRTSILAVARNLPAIVIAADLVDLRRDPHLDNQFRDWLRLVRDTQFSGDGGSHTIAGCHETRPNNFGSHCGAARLAIALYLDDAAEVERAATVFHGWLGNRDAYASFTYGRLTWQADPDRPVGINPPGAVKEGQPIGGALPEEMRRAGDFRWPPKRTGYVWEALQGALVQAQLLSRAGYLAWQWEDQALLRAVTFLYQLGWEPNGDDTWQPWLVNYAYGAAFPTRTPARPGKNIGWTDWTHAAPRPAVGFEAPGDTVAPGDAVLEEDEAGAGPGELE